MLTRVNIEQVINKECGGLRSDFEGRSSSSGTSTDVYTIFTDACIFTRRGY